MSTLLRGNPSEDANWPENVQVFPSAGWPENVQVFLSAGWPETVQVFLSAGWLENVTRCFCLQASFFLEVTAIFIQKKLYLIASNLKSSGALPCWFTPYW